MEGEHHAPGAGLGVERTMEARPEQEAYLVERTMEARPEVEAYIMEVECRAQQARRTTRK